MALHTVVFASADVQTEFLPLSGISDEVFGTYDGGLIPREPTRLVAAVAGGSTLTGARLSQRSMDITPANIYPLNTLPWGSPVAALCHPTQGPRLPGGEAVVAFARADTNTATGVVVCWFADRLEPVPDGEHFLLDFEIETSLTALRWVATGPINLRSILSLPAGRYHVVGMEMHSSDGMSAFAARLLLPNQINRPGAIVHDASPITGAVRRLPPDFQLDGSLGSWGWFEQGSLPRLEVVGLQDATLASLQGHLRIVREGGASRGAQSRTPTWG